MMIFRFSEDFYFCNVSVPTTSQSFDDAPSLCANMGEDSQLRSCAVSPGGADPGGL